MKKLKLIIALLMTAFLAAGFGSCNKINGDWRPNEMDLKVSSDILKVEKVENIPDDFIFGMDDQWVWTTEEISSGSHCKHHQCRC